MMIGTGKPVDVKVTIGKIWRVLYSVPFMTFLVLVGLDYALRQVNIVDQLGVRSVDIWNVPPRIELSKKTCPQVGLIGSSLLLVMNQDEKGTHFYSGTHPPYLEELFSKATGEKISCINLCSGLQMPSEAYFITQALTNGTKCYPKVLIYGLALREFVNDRMALEYMGECFNSVAPMVPMTWDNLNGLSCWESKRDFLLCHYWYLYRDRVDFKNLFSAYTKDTLENLPLDESYSRIGEDHQWTNSKNGYLFEYWVPSRMEKFADSAYKKNPRFLHDYYHEWHTGIYAGTFKLAQTIGVVNMVKLAKFCNEKGILLVVVNMPLDPEFINLAPPGFYDRFRQDLAESSRNLGYVYIDLVLDPDYPASSFKDGLHLNYDGARRLANRFVKIFETQYPFVLTKMKEQVRDMALHQ